MGFIFFILLIFAVVWAKQNLEISKICKGLNAEQKKVAKYMFGGMLVFGKINDEQYDEMVRGKLNSLNLRQRALDKIGLDEDQVSEIAPVNFHGYDCSDSVRKTNFWNIYAGKDNRLRSSQYESVWLFFSDSQVYMFKYHFDMLSENKKENTEEYFYRDITNFSTQSETIEAYVVTGCSGKHEKTVTREYSRFGLIVPGDKFYCSTTNSDNVDESISAMKQKLREKKNA